MLSPGTLNDYVASATGSGPLTATIDCIADGAAGLARRISQGPLAGALGSVVGSNMDGDRQTALDTFADDLYCDRLRNAPVRWFASEEREEPEKLDPDGALAVAIDPLDGSSNIDVNVSIGTIFSIFDAADDGDGSFLRPGHEQRAAGYIIFGPHTSFLLTVGKGVVKLVLDPETGRFVIVDRDVRIPEKSFEFAINSSNYAHWPDPIKAYIDDCLAGEKGPRGRKYNMRWIASLVAEAHRIMMRGGIFLYPADSRPGYERGRLRTVYECAPISFLVEQAGGIATDGMDRLLDQVPASLHARTPFIFGSAEKVARVAAYHDLPASEISPLFGDRGLFRA